MRKGRDTLQSLLYDSLPIMKEGFIGVRSVVNTIIERIEEKERGAEDLARRDTLESLGSFVHDEIDKVARKARKTAADNAKVKAFETVRSHIEDELGKIEEKEAVRKRKAKKVEVE